MKTPEQREKERQEKNREILDAVKAGTYYATFDAQASFFPARPLVKKDQKEMARIYGEPNG